MSTHTIDQHEVPTAAPAAGSAAIQPTSGRIAPVPAPADSPSKPAPASLEAPAPPRRNRLPFVIAGVIAAALLGLGARQWLYSRNHVGTDDAQIEGHIVPVSPKVGGFVAEVRVSENQPVGAGDTLVVLDDRDFAAHLRQAEADLAVALASGGTRSRAGKAEAQVAAARANVAQAEAAAWKAHADLERYRALAERAVVGRQQLDAAQAGAEAADAQLAAAREQVTAAEAALAGASAKVASAAAARDQAALQLAYTWLEAPAAGVVSKKNVEVGQLVQVGQPLMSVVPLDDVWVVANLKETEVRDVTPGDAAVIRVDTYPGRAFEGRVESLSPASGARFSLLPPDNATGNFTKVVQRIPVRLRFVGPPDPRRVLRPGMSVEVSIRTR